MSFSFFYSLDEVYAATEKSFCRFWQQEGCKLGLIRPQNDAVIEVSFFCKIIGREVICKYRKKSDNWWKPKRLSKTCIAAVMFRSCIHKTIHTPTFTLLGEQRFLEIEAKFMKKWVRLPQSIYKLECVGIFCEQGLCKWLVFLLVCNNFNSYLDVQLVYKNFLECRIDIDEDIKKVRKILTSTDLNKLAKAYWFLSVV